MEKEEVLDFLKRLAESIAVMFGENCETLIHDMSVPGHPILAIYHPQVSGREVGSTLDIYGNKPGEGIFNETILKRDFVNMQVVTMTGKRIKSTTIHFHGDGYSYALGINYDYTKLQQMDQFLNNFLQVNRDLYTEIEDTEHTGLEEIVDDCISGSERRPERNGQKGTSSGDDSFKGEKCVPFSEGSPLRIGAAERVRYTIYKYMNEIWENKREPVSATPALALERKMSQYDFETIVKRRPANLKLSATDPAVLRAGNVSFDGAEPDFKSAPAIEHALKALAENGLYGFTLCDDVYREAVSSWMRRERTCEIDPQWIVPTLGHHPFCGNCHSIIYKRR